VLSSLWLFKNAFHSSGSTFKGSVVVIFKFERPPQLNLLKLCLANI